MPHSDARAHQGPLADFGTAVLAAGSFLVGVVIGASGPLFYVVIVVAFAGGPTWGGLALLGAFVVGAVFTVVVLVALAAGHRPYLGIAVVAASAAFIVGVFAGVSFGTSAHLGGWAHAQATPAPSIPSLPTPSSATHLKGDADVTIQLDAQSGFTSNQATRGPDGTFGHRCSSGPDSTLVGRVTAMEVASKGTLTIYADLQLTDPMLIDLGTQPTYPRLVLQLREPAGMTAYLWAGPVRVVANHGMSGTVAFDALVADPPPPGMPHTLSGRLSWACRAWSNP